MKNLVLVAIAIFMIASCQKSEKYKVHVTTPEKAEEAYILEVENNELVVLDSAKWDNGFTFTGTVERPQLVYFSKKGTNERTMFFLENEKINISPDPEDSTTYKIEGTKLNEIYETFMDSSEVIGNQLKGIYSEYQLLAQSGDKEKLDSLKSLNDTLYKKLELYRKSYAEKNIGNMVGLYILYRNLLHTMDYTELKDKLALVPEQNKDNQLYENLDAHMEKLGKTRVGEVAPDFTMKDTAGNDVSLSDLRGNHVLIDFWASWCSPCRRANPHVVEIYKEFSPKGFEILGVSFDNNKEAWIQAIHDDNLTWYHVSDLKGWQNAVGQKYGIRSIPHTILIDPEGKIIMNQFTHEELREKMEEIYN